MTNVNELIGQTGQIIRNVEVIDAKESTVGGTQSIDIRVSDNMGEVYWTSLENVELD
ncbi:hypothetical protein [Bacillus toyonensis]|uniref:hypothetical protein n=1 Tax=Bacillus toyonensis TaxID=155322 RepID=UPI001C3F16A1|nr:hypothetical protein [Bacillus toyonensis]